MDWTKVEGKLPDVEAEHPAVQRLRQEGRAIENEH